MLKKPQRRLQEPRQDLVAVIPQLHPTQLCNIADSCLQMENPSTPESQPPGTSLWPASVCSSVKGDGLLPTSRVAAETKELRHHSCWVPEALCHLNLFLILAQECDNLSPTHSRRLAPQSHSTPSPSELLGALCSSVRGGSWPAAEMGDLTEKSRSGNHRRQIAFTISDPMTRL